MAAKTQKKTIIIMWRWGKEPGSVVGGETDRKKGQERSKVLNREKLLPHRHRFLYYYSLWVISSPLFPFFHFPSPVDTDRFKCLNWIWILKIKFSSSDSDSDLPGRWRAKRNRRQYLMWEHGLWTLSAPLELSWLINSSCPTMAMLSASVSQSSQLFLFFFLIYN